MDNVDIDILIKQAEELKSVDYDSPKVLLWKKRAKNFILTNYEHEYKQILDRALSFDQMIMSEGHARQMHINALNKAIVLLNELKSEPKIDKNKPQPLPKEIKESSHKESKYGRVDVKGMAFFGDNAVVNQVVLGDLVKALESEIKERVVEGEEKKSVLDSLKKITNNETFASVTGVVLGEVLKRISRP